MMVVYIFFQSCFPRSINLTNQMNFAGFCTVLSFSNPSIQCKFFKEIIKKIYLDFLFYRLSKLPQSHNKVKTLHLCYNCCMFTSIGIFFCMMMALPLMYLYFTLIFNPMCVKEATPPWATYIAPLDLPVSLLLLSGECDYRDAQASS